MICGFFAMAPAAIYGEKHGKGKEIFMISIVIIFVAFLAMGFTNTAWIFVIGVVLFFIGFNMFEPLLQSFVAKYAKVHQKGSALAVANTFGYVGIFSGGIMGGWVMQHHDRGTLALIVGVVSLAWFLWVYTMPSPNNRGNVYLPLDLFNREQVAALTEHEAIVESYVNETEQVAVVKFNKDLIDEDEVRGMLS